MKAAGADADSRSTWELRHDIRHPAEAAVAAVAVGVEALVGCRRSVALKRSAFEAEKKADAANGRERHKHPTKWSTRD